MQEEVARLKDVAVVAEEEKEELQEILAMAQQKLEELKANRSVSMIILHFLRVVCDHESEAFTMK